MAFDALSQATQNVASRLMIVISLLFPVLFRLPTRRNKLLKQLNANMNEIAVELLGRSRREDTVAVDKESKLASKSVIELLSERIAFETCEFHSPTWSTVKAESGNALMPEEVQAQVIQRASSISWSWPNHGIDECVPVGWL
jgi:hypothetical protein